MFLFNCQQLTHKDLRSVGLVFVLAMSVCVSAQGVWLLHIYLLCFLVLEKWGLLRFLIFGTSVTSRFMYIAT